MLWLLGADEFETSRIGNGTGDLPVGLTGTAGQGADAGFAGRCAHRKGRAGGLRRIPRGRVQRGQLCRVSAEGGAETGRSFAHFSGVICGKTWRSP